jgi:hypothetical protein
LVISNISNVFLTSDGILFGYIIPKCEIDNICILAFATYCNHLFKHINTCVNIRFINKCVRKYGNIFFVSGHTIKVDVKISIEVLPLWV